jgi:hypothetical protein
MFNMKKHAKKAEENNETRLQKERGKFDTELPEVTGNLNSLLDDSRKNPDGDKTHEGQLESVHEAAVDRITDGQLQNQKSEFSRKNNEKEKLQGLPINNLALAREQEQIKAFNKASEKKRDTEFWDKYVGDQMEGKVTKQVANNAPSQLQTSTERVKGVTVENVKDNKKLKEMVMASLKDADAMLFHIYHTASGRELSSEEKMLVDGINADKVKILSMEK